jgi:hypothetical protein
MSVYESQVPSNEKSFTSLPRDEILKIQDNKIFQLADTFSIDLPIARALLLKQDWILEEAAKSIVEEGIDTILFTAGVVKRTTAPGTCDICYEDYAKTSEWILTEGCNHRLCIECYSEYLVNELEQGV